MKFTPGGRSPPAWLFQNPKWPPNTPENLQIYYQNLKFSIAFPIVTINTFIVHTSVSLMASVYNHFRSLSAILSIQQKILSNWN